MKTLRLLVAALFVSTGISFAQTQSPTNMLATYNSAMTFLATLSTSQSNSLISQPDDPDIAIGSLEFPGLVQRDRA